MALLVLLFAVGVYFACFYESEGFFLEKYANADAKFYNDHIITSVDEGVYMFDFDGNVVKSYEELKASWMYVYAEEGLVVYSNHDNETHLLRLDENMDMFELEAEELLARAVCHECDHLDGIMYTSHVVGELHDVNYEEDEE